MSRSVVYTLHLWPPLEHAKHYTGSSRKLPERLMDHALGRGARMLQVQLERGGFWVVAQTEPGDVRRERQLKNEGGAARRCQVCKAVDYYLSGELSQEEALSRAGWDRASEFERSLLLDMFGIEHAPERTEQFPGAPAAHQVPEPHLEEEPHVQQDITPEVNALVDALIEGWSQEAKAEPELRGAAQLPEVPAPRRAPETQLEEEPQVSHNITPEVRAQIEDITPEVSAQIEGWSQEAEAEPELEIGA